jgi:nucleoside phosphorylase
MFSDDEIEGGGAHPKLATIAMIWSRHNLVALIAESKLSPCTSAIHSPQRLTYLDDGSAVTLLIQRAGGYMRQSLLRLNFSEEYLTCMTSAFVEALSSVLTFAGRSSKLKLALVALEHSMDYELGLKQLKAQLQQNALEQLPDLTTFEARLRDNIRRERLYGTTETIRAERAEIISGLNQIVQTYLRISFNDLCVPDQTHILGNQLPLSKTQQTPVDFAIITALEKEVKAVVRRLENHEIKRFEDRDIRTYHLGTIPIYGQVQPYRVVVVTLPSMGNVSAANAVTDTISQWQPRFVLMVGIAGGIPQDDLDLGDVVIAEQVVGYDYGKVTDQGIKPRDRVYPASSLLLDRVRNFWDETWTQRVNIARPSNAARALSKAFVGPIASGNKVVASTEFRDQLLKHWPKLIAVEMESEGVLAAVFDRPQIRGTLVIRGICDMADKRKADDWQEYAADIAAAYTISLLKSGPVEPVH